MCGWCIDYTPHVAPWCMQCLTSQLRPQNEQSIYLKCLRIEETIDIVEAVEMLETIKIVETI